MLLVGKGVNFPRQAILYVRGPYLSTFQPYTSTSLRAAGLIQNYPDPTPRIPSGSIKETTEALTRPRSPLFPTARRLFPQLIIVIHITSYPAARPDPHHKFTPAIFPGIYLAVQHSFLSIIPTYHQTTNSPLQNPKTRIILSDSQSPHVTFRVHHYLF